MAPRWKRYILPARYYEHTSNELNLVSLEVRPAYLVGRQIWFKRGMPTRPRWKVKPVRPRYAGHTSLEAIARYGGQQRHPLSIFFLLF